MSLPRLAFAAVGWLFLSAPAAAFADELADIVAKFATQAAAGRWDQADSLAAKLTTLAGEQVSARYLAAANSLAEVAREYQRYGRYAQSEPLLRRSAEVVEAARGRDHPDVAAALTALGSAQAACADYEAAQRSFQRSLEIRRRAFGTESRPVASNLNHLGNLSKDRGRYAEADALYLEAQRIFESHDKNSGDVSMCLNNRAYLYRLQGRYAQSERLYKQALAIDERTLGPRNVELGISLNNLANLYVAQGRYADAEPLLTRARQIVTDALGENHPTLAYCLNNLAMVFDGQERHADAEPLFERALTIRRAALGEEHPLVATSLNNLARCREALGQFASARALLQIALAVREKRLGPDHPEVGETLLELACVEQKQNSDADIEPLVDRALDILDRANANPAVRFRGYDLRAQAAWRAGRRSEAVKDLDRALGMAELIRGHAAGAEQERAEQFAAFTAAFERMVAWQVELNDAAGVLDAMERGRARSLLDEMNLSGAALDVGRPVAERERLAEQEAELKGRIAELERQLAHLPPSDDTAAGLQRTRLESDLADAREQLYDHYRQQRGSSRVYRALLTVDAASPRLSQIQRRLVGESGLLLVYFLGDEASYVLVITPDAARATRLVADGPAAQTLGIPVGPITARRLRSVLVGDEASCVLRQLASPDLQANAVDKLAALWTLLVPQAERDAIAAGRAKRLIVVPDGPLSLLPFETLVVVAGERPRHLLDVGPPVVYAPSTTVLYNLNERRTATLASEAGQAVLTVGNPLYGPADAPFEGAGAALADKTGGQRGVALKLAALPYSGTESSWVAEAFKKRGIPVLPLRERLATEANVRMNAPGRTLLHLACHGLADQAYGNFFGSLALTPGASAATNPADDGFLTMPEIYELNLKQCELAILSACQTNYGPQQKGEGVWALSRGFLVAGSRRVVASNWLVDDEAAASLISVFCSDLAKTEGQGETPDYAAALHRAKRWVRGQAKWASPYYWGTFVLVGPN
jgi:tetratricopeptide (TPR) repeat protein